MFDFRYHVASLAAVFVALVIGILVGVGLSGRGFVNDAERSVLQGQIDDLKTQRDAVVDALDDAELRGLALDDYSETTYPSLVKGRLRDRKLAVLFVGSIDQGISAAIRRAVRDAGGSITRVRAVGVPIDPAAIGRALPPGDRREYVGQARWEALGKALGREYVAGGPTPLWDALTEAIVVKQEGAPRPPVDGVVIARPARPQSGVSKAFLSGLYQGLAGAGRPTVGVETAAATVSAVPAFRRGGLSTVDSVESAAGRLAVILLLAGGRPGKLRRRRHRGRRRAAACRSVREPLTVLIAARDEEQSIGATVEGLRSTFPEATIVVADDGSRDATARLAAAAGAHVVALARRGKGQALTLGEKSCPPGHLLLVDADLRGEITPLLESNADLAIAAFRRRSGDGLGIAKRAARRLIAARSGLVTREPLSGQRALTPRARAALFPVAAGFGVETRMTIDAVRAGLEIEEVELDLEHRATGRDLAGFAHRGRQLVDLALACGPQGTSFRGLRLPLIGVITAVAQPTAAPVMLAGLADDLWSGPERGFRSHLTAGATTGTLKLVAIPLWGLIRTRSISGAIVVGLAANLVNQLDTRPGRALKAVALGSLALRGRPRRALAMTVLIAPYDLREMTMLGDAGSNTLGAVLGFESVRQLTSRGRMGVIAGLAALTVLGERTSLGRLIETTPGLRELDRLGKEAMSERPTKYIFVTGGVVSALGKGIVAASLGRLLKARGLRIQAQKFDPYLNVDPGTMSPFQHGEVFVTEDGAETDLDLGHYERFIDENLSRNGSHSAGAVWDTVLRKERKGEFLGATVQVIPHITNEIKARIRRAAATEPVDVVISEIGGTVGDIESLPFLEAIRQFRREVGPENVLYLHVTLVPFIEAAGELKTKPTQHSVNELRRIGIHPDVIVCRSREDLSSDIREKIALFADVDAGAVIGSPDVPDVYLVPEKLQSEGLDTLVCKHLGLDTGPAELGAWKELTDRIADRHEEVEIALVGKYVKLHDAYLSVHEALKHAGLHHGARVRVRWVDAEDMTYEEAVAALDLADGLLIPGGFGSRGWEGKILACRVAREREIPYLGICLGMHVAVSEFARHVCGLEGANSTEMDPETPYPVIDLLPEQKEIEDLGGTMRLGAQAVEVAEGTRARDAYGEAVIHERHRHRYEVNNNYRQQLLDAGLVISGTFQQGRLVEMIELPEHPWFVASQFHPEFKSRPTRPAPLFLEFVGAALGRARARSGSALAVEA